MTCPKLCQRKETILITIVSIVLFISAASNLYAATVKGWGEQVVGGDPSGGFVKVSAGGSHSLALKQDGSIVAWGYNWKGQCSIPSPNSGFIAISAGGFHSLALKQDGSIIAWGNKDSGQCKSLRPIAVLSLSPQAVTIPSA